MPEHLFNVGNGYDRSAVRPGTTTTHGAEAPVTDHRCHCEARKGCGNPHPQRCKAPPVPYGDGKRTDCHGRLRALAMTAVVGGWSYFAGSAAVVPIRTAERSMPVPYIGVAKFCVGRAVQPPVGWRYFRFNQHSILPGGAATVGSGKNACGKAEGSVGQSYGLPSPTLGFSHGLKTCPRHVFLTAFRIPLSPCRQKKADTLLGVCFFLGWIMGFEPTTFRATI